MPWQQVNRLWALQALVVLSIHLPASLAPGQDWITAPQLCRGRAYSESARATQWPFDREQRIALATPELGMMPASHVPGAGANFVVNIRLRLAEGAQCRLLLDDVRFDVSHSGSDTLLETNEQQATVALPAADPQTGWLLLTVRRRDGQISAELNGEHILDLGASTRAFTRISLGATRGTVAVSNYVVTGEVQRRPPQE